MSDLIFYFFWSIWIIGTNSHMNMQLGNRPQVERGRSFQLTEEDVLRASRAVLPIANSMISTAQVIFSGEPSMTLKVSLKFY